MDQHKHGWVWAYRKARGYHLSAFQASYRATRFFLCGDTGAFSSHGGWRRSRISRK